MSKRRNRWREWRAWGWLGTAWAASFTGLLLLCGAFLMGIGATLIHRAFATKAEPDVVTAVALQRTAVSGFPKGSRNPHLRVTQATPFWARLWTYEAKSGRVRRVVHYLPLSPATVYRDPLALEGEPPGEPALLLRLTPEQLDSLRRQTPPAYRGLRMDSLDVVAPERNALEEHFGPAIFKSLPVLSYEETPTFAGNLAGGVMNILFGAALGYWAVRRPRSQVRANRGTPAALNGFMLLAIALLSAGFLAGVNLLVQEVLTAPVGVETENGFEVTWCNDRPGTRDVSCIWKVRGAGDAAGAHRFA
jgi:hypothetical protein